MTNSNSKSGSQPPDSSDPLSATGMFLRAFEQDVKKDAPPEDPFGFDSPARPVSATPVPPPATVPPSSAASGPAPGAGEFTQMFNAMGQHPAPAAPVKQPPPLVRGPREEGFPRGVEVSSPVKGPPQPPPVNASSGDFTRIFVSGVPPAQTPPARPPEDAPRPVPPPSAQPGAKTEGGFTQFFSTNAARPAAPVPSPAPPPKPLAASPAADTSWKDDPFFQPVEKKSPVSGAPSSSVTGILSSLAGSGAGTAPTRVSEPAPYRPEALPSSAPPKPAAEEPGGVTRLIKRLSQEQAAPRGPSQPAAPPPPSDSGPGEFTRIIQGLGPRSAPVSAPPPRPPAPAGPVFAVAPPAMPSIAPPHMPALPHMPAAHAPAQAPPPAPVFAVAPMPPMPAIPKPPVPQLPALAPPKGKLEAMVPILLVINTFLLVLLLVVVIFLIKAR